MLSNFQQGPVVSLLCVLDQFFRWIGQDALETDFCGNTLPSLRGRPKMQWIKTNVDAADST